MPLRLIPSKIKKVRIQQLYTSSICALPFSNVSRHKNTCLRRVRQQMSRQSS